MSTKEDLIRKWAALQDEEESLKDRIGDLKKEKAKIVLEVEGLLDKKSTFFEGWWYNIKRTRNGDPYFSRSEKEPGSWLRKKKEDKK